MANSSDSTSNLTFESWSRDLSEDQRNGLACCYCDEAEGRLVPARAGQRPSDRLGKGRLMCHRPCARTAELELAIAGLAAENATLRERLDAVVSVDNMVRCRGLVVVDEDGYDRITLAAKRHGSSEMRVLSPGGGMWSSLYTNNDQRDEDGDVWCAGFYVSKQGFGVAGVESAEGIDELLVGLPL